MAMAVPSDTAVGGMPSYIPMDQDEDRPTTADVNPFLNTMASDAIPGPSSSTPTSTKKRRPPLPVLPNYPPPPAGTVIPQYAFGDYELTESDLRAPKLGATRCCELTSFIFQSRVFWLAGIQFLPLLPLHPRRFARLSVLSLVAIIIFCLLISRMGRWGSG